MEKPRLSSVTLFAVSCVVLVLEVALTRIFSFVTWYHLTYLVISLALLGYGAAGTHLAINTRLAKSDYSYTIGVSCLLFSLLTIIALMASVRFPVSAEGFFEGHYRLIFPILLTHLILSLPFFLAGTVVGYILMRNRAETNRLYSADLLGAGVGSLLAVFLINYLGAVSAIFLVAALPALVAAAAFKKGSGLLRLGSAGVATLFLAGAIVSLNHQIIPLRVTPEKDIKPYQIIFTKWNILNRIDAVSPRIVPFHYGGRMSDAYQGPQPPIILLFQDGTAPTALMHVGGKPRDFALLNYFVQSAPYTVRPAPDRVLVIGVGGGIDALIAEHAGAGHIVGVDINPTTIDLLSHRYRWFSEDLFREGNLDLVVSEGRHYLTRTSAKFDVIQLSGVDTWAALSGGNFVLSESYLYTTEAVVDLLNHLNDAGILSYSRWLFSPPRESLKLVVTECEALRRLGIKDPSEHFLIVAGGPPEGRWADTIIKKTPFTQQDAAALQSWANQMRFDIVYDPFQAHANAFNEYLAAREPQQRAFVDSYEYDIEPSHDDQPFFFQFFRWKNALHPTSAEGVGGHPGYPVGKIPKGLVSILVALVELLCLCLVFVLLPLTVKKSLGLNLRLCLPWMVVFAGLGMGFIAVEMVLMQKLSVFLGGPAYSMAITLCSLLIFSGIGSRLSQNAASLGYRAAVWMVLGVVLVQGLELAFLDWGVPALLGLDHVWRCIIAIVAIAPAGLMMGMPFPTLLAKSGEVSESLLPWAWGVNACATTLGSILATISSITMGFNRTWLVAMGMYVVVLVVVVSLRSQESAQASEGVLTPARL